MTGARVGLSSWDALVAHLEARYPPLQRRADGVVFPCAAPGARTIEVGVHASSHVGGATWLVLVATLGPARLLRPRCAMIAMTDLPMGAAAVAGDVALFRHGLPLASLTAAGFDATVRVFVDIVRELIDAQGYVEVERPDAVIEPNDARFAYIYW